MRSTVHLCASPIAYRVFTDDGSSNPCCGVSDSMKDKGCANQTLDTLFTHLIAVVECGKGMVEAD